MNKTKKPRNQKVEKTELSNDDKLAQIGQDIQTILKKQFEQWGGGLPYKLIISQKSHEAKRLGFTTTGMATVLEEKGFIKIFNTPTGTRYVFSGDCPLTTEEMQHWLQDQEISKQAIRDLNKMKKA